MILLFSHRARMERRIAAYHAGELSAAATEAVARHLSKCPSCGAELQALEETARLLRGAAPRVPSLPPETSRALFARALNQSGVLHRRPRAGWRLYAWATPAVLLLLLGGGLAVRELRKPTQPPTEQLAVVAPTPRTEPTALGAARSQPAAGGLRKEPSAAPRIRRRALKRRVRASTSPKTRLEVVKLLPSTPLEWIPEPVVAPGVERVELVADADLAAPAATESAPQRAANRWPAPVVEVQVTMVKSEPAGTARVAAWWREPSGEWFWKQARVPQDDKQVELVLVSLSRERIWGYWKEETE